MKEIVIVSAVRTAIGSFGGSLKNVDAVTLGKAFINYALESKSIHLSHDELIGKLAFLFNIYSMVPQI